MTKTKPVSLLIPSTGIVLTPRELDLLELACEGLIDKEISARLEIALATVQTYWERIRTKLEATNKSHAIAKYLQLPRNKTAELGPELEGFMVNAVDDDAVFALDHEGILRTWNPGVERIFEYVKDEWIGSHCSIIFPVEEQESATQELRDAAAAKVSLNYRWHVRKDGTRFWGANLVLDLGQTEIVGTFVKIVRPKENPLGCCLGK